MSLALYLNKAPWFLLSSIVTKAMGFFLLPIHTSFLSPAELGALATYESVGRVLLIMMSLYLDAAFLRYYYVQRTSKSISLGIYFSSHLWFLLGWSLLIALTFFYGAKPLLKTFPKIGLLPFISLIFSQLVNQLIVMVTSIWQAELLAKRIALLQISTASGIFIVTYIFLNSNLGWESKLISTALVSAIQGTILLTVAIYKKWLRLQLSPKLIRRSLAYSLPLLPSVAAGWITMFSDRLILSHYGMVDQVGIYSVAAQLALVVYVCNDAITRIQGPLAMRGMTADINQSKDDAARFFAFNLVFLSAVYASFLIFSPNIVSLVAPGEYSGASDILIFLGLIYVASGVYRIFTNVISFFEKVWIISVGALLQGMSNIIMNFLLIPMYGMHGAAFSSLASMLFFTAYIYYHSQKQCYINVSRSSLLLSVLFVLVGVFATVSDMAISERLEFKILCVVLIGAMSGIFGWHLKKKFEII